MNTWSKVEGIIDLAKSGDIKEIKDLLMKKEEEKKKSNTILWVFAVIGAIAAVAAIAYAVYHYFTPDYLEDFEDDFDDDFDDEFFEDEDCDLDETVADDLEKATEK